MHVDSAKARNGGPRRIEGSRGTPITFNFDGQSIEAFEGETIAAALLASGVRTLRETNLKGRAARPVLQHGDLLRLFG